MPRGEEEIFLAAHSELILTRFVPEQAGFKPLKPDQGDEKLRILIVKSQPRELDTVAAQKLIDEIRKLQSDHIIDVKVFEGRPTLGRLRDCISGSDDSPGYRPHVVHFMGHGRAGELALVKEDARLAAEDLQYKQQRERGEATAVRPDEAQWIDMESVKTLFIRYKPRVVFLHACEGAAPDSLKAFSNTARELAYSHIPAVIAMQYQIGNDDAELFAKKFYRKLREGTFVDEAVKEARRELGLSVTKPGRNVWDDRSFGTPVIYLQSEQPVILPPPENPVREDVGRSEVTVLGKVPCPNPNCQGKVIYGRLICLACMKAIAVCPICKVMMLPEIGICDNGHRLDSAQSSHAPITGTTLEQRKAKPAGVSL